MAVRSTSGDRRVGDIFQSIAELQFFPVRALHHIARNRLHAGPGTPDLSMSGAASAAFPRSIATFAPNSMLPEAKSCGSDMDQGEQAAAAQLSTADLASAGIGDRDLR
ncbi:hypothetical protein [Mesorhizobium tianshanense]|uniref:hypothetical protein n=1 Tax=Mesorhizobium tianshanense TaxID=39844 RepID=UPI001F0B11A7|nr:hypothetical protein [Mesorhizobium tianshanense]